MQPIQVPAKEKEGEVARSAGVLGTEVGTQALPTCLY